MNNVTCRGTMLNNESAYIKRNPHYDNIKFYLIFLVVLGHMLELLISEVGFLKSFYSFIYIFHMPMFALLSGYLSNMKPALENLKINTIRILLPYLIFQTICLFLKSISEHTINYDYLTPRAALWFLLSLYIWRSILPFVVKYRVAIFLSLAFAIICGYCGFIGREYNLSRTIVYFPFFLSGYYLKTYRRLDFSAMLFPRRLSIFILLMASIICFSFDFPIECLYHSRPYHSFAHFGWCAGFYRLFAMTAAVVVGLSFLSLVPVTENKFTRIGERSIYIYILHYFIQKPLMLSGVANQFPTIYVLIGLIIVTILTILLCSSDMIVRLTSPLIEPASIFNKR